VSTTSSRFSALIVWLSIRTVLNHQVGSPQGAFSRRLTDYLHRWEYVLPVAKKIRFALLEAARCSDKVANLPNTGRRKP
ncbi:hypothetical protein, partial [Bradyrhizobium sp. LeoA1S1]